MKKGTYDVRMGSGDLVSVTASEFELPGIGVLIVHRDVEYDKQWTISEPRSGATFLRMADDTRKRAIEKAGALGITPEVFEKAVSQVLEKHKEKQTTYERNRCEQVEAR